MGDSYKAQGMWRDRQATLHRQLVSGVQSISRVLPRHISIGDLRIDSVLTPLVYRKLRGFVENKL